MDQATKARIFEPYYTTKEVGEGTGLGLATILGIVTENGGAIDVSSKPGEGTTFKVFFPVYTQAEDVTRSAREHDTEPLVRGKGEHILLVDDESSIVDLNQTVLRELGYEITARTSSIEALEAFRASPNRFDAVVTDQTMPQMTGLKLAKEIIAIRPGVPIILCTGFSQIGGEEEALAAGICDFAMKPIIPRDLATRIRRVLDGRPNRSAGTAPG
jgi:CheY-like chemotaxis protein